MLSVGKLSTLVSDETACVEGAEVDRRSNVKEKNPIASFMD